MKWLYELERSRVVTKGPLSFSVMIGDNDQVKKRLVARRAIFNPAFFLSFLLRTMLLLSTGLISLRDHCFDVPLRQRDVLLLLGRLGAPTWAFRLRFGAHCKDFFWFYLCVCGLIESWRRCSLLSRSRLAPLLLAMVAL